MSSSHLSSFRSVRSPCACLMLACACWMSLQLGIMGITVFQHTPAVRSDNVACIHAFNCERLAPAPSFSSLLLSLASSLSSLLSSVSLSSSSCIKCIFCSCLFFLYWCHLLLFHFIQLSFLLLFLLNRPYWFRIWIGPTKSSIPNSDTANRSFRFIRIRRCFGQGKG